MKNGMKLNDLATMLNIVMYFMFSMPWKNHIGNITLPMIMPKKSMYKVDSDLNLSKVEISTKRTMKLIKHKTTRPIIALFR